MIVTYPDELLYNPVAKMLRNDVGRLPVVSRENPNQAVGYLGRVNAMSARLRQFEEEQIREQGLRG